LAALALVVSAALASASKPGTANTPRRAGCALGFTKAEIHLRQESDQRQRWFVKTDATGQRHFLHMVDLTKTTTDPRLAWSGTERQAHNVRARYPIARTLPLIRKDRSKQNPR